MKIESLNPEQQNRLNCELAFRIAPGEKTARLAHDLEKLRERQTALNDAIGKTMQETEADDIGKAAAGLSRSRHELELTDSLVARRMLELLHSRLADGDVLVARGEAAERRCRQARDDARAAAVQTMSTLFKNPVACKEAMDRLEFGGYFASDATAAANVARNMANGIAGDTRSLVHRIAADEWEHCMYVTGPRPPAAPTGPTPGETVELRIQKIETDYPATAAEE